MLQRPLVLTVHDLAHPHLADPARHDAALDVLVPAADAVLTLTAGAAAEIRARWGREAVVVPHPHVLPLDRLDRPRATHDGFVVGLQAKPRANNAPGTVRAEPAAAVDGLPGAAARAQPGRRAVRRRAVGLPDRTRRVGAAVPLRHPLGLAGGVRWTSARRCVAPRGGYAEQHAASSATTWTCPAR